MSRQPLALVLGLLLTTSGCREPDETERLLSALKSVAPIATAAAAPAAGSDINPRLLRRFEPLRSQFETSDNSLTSGKVELGRMLFFEQRLSKRHNQSCNTCHDLARFGVDGQATSAGSEGLRGARNSPSVYNAAGHFAQFWDGRAPTPEEQATGPILNPIEMGLASAEDVTRLLQSMPEYVRAFEAAFPGEARPITLDNVGRAIGAFERKLTTPARWDEFLRGKQDALSKRELEGLKVFTNVGCMVCHTGELLGGSMYQKVGVVEPWPNQKDQGRFEVTKQATERMMFKVPSLRNVAQTAPYFHDGSAATLELAVKTMGKYQLGLSLSEDEIGSVVAWLGSLTGALPADLIQPPTLPPSSSSTPGPRP